jgi:hypothetical protein
LWPQRQGCEAFFACRLRAPGDVSDRTTGSAALAGVLPPAHAELERWLPAQRDAGGLHCWERAGTLFAASVAAASCALPAEARGLRLGRLRGGRCDLEPWAAQALIERGAEAETVTRAEACAMWAGCVSVPHGSGTLLRTAEGAPLGLVAGDGRLDLPSRLRRFGLV